MTYNSRNPAVKRILKEAKELSEPNNLFHARPLNENIFEWHFTIRGPEDTEFSGGVYHGRILLPSEYPMKPPNIVLLTPNGRFDIHRKICLSISGFHPESWRPSWSIRTALLAIIGFMPTPGAGAIGSLDMPSEDRKQLAVKSKSFVCDICGPVKDILSSITSESQSLGAAEVAEATSQMTITSVPLTTETAANTPNRNSVPAGAPAMGTGDHRSPLPAQHTGVTAQQPTTETTAQLQQQKQQQASSNAWWQPPPLVQPASRPDDHSAPLQLCYWLCYPVYLPANEMMMMTTQTLMNNHNSGGGGVVATASQSGDDRLPTADRQPLSFTEWLKQKREQEQQDEKHPQKSPESAAARTATRSPASEPIITAGSSSSRRAASPSRDTTTVTGVSVHQRYQITRQTQSPSLLPQPDLRTPAEVKDDSQVLTCDPASPSPVTTSSEGRETILSAAVREETMSVGGQTAASEKSDQHRTKSCVCPWEETKSTGGGEDMVASDGQEDAEDEELRASPLQELSACISRSSGDSLLQRLGTDDDKGREVEEVGDEMVISRGESVLQDDTAALVKVASAADEQLPGQTYSIPSESRSLAASPHESAVVSRYQYRAVTVCAVGVAISLFLVVMRRLALMLHDL